LIEEGNLESALLVIEQAVAQNHPNRSFLSLLGSKICLSLAGRESKGIELAKGALEDDKAFQPLATICLALSVSNLSSTCTEIDRVASHVGQRVPRESVVTYKQLH